MSYAFCHHVLELDGSLLLVVLGIISKQHRPTIV